MSGIYIHIPYCRQACTYCDFHFSTSMQTMDAMIESIRKEIILRKDYLSGEKIQTIYFGGGTPSLVGGDKLEIILKTIKEEFEADEDAEITLEANPDDLTPEKSRELFGLGINRLSIGLQSFSDQDLKFMNRAHNAAQSFSAVDNARKAGFTNLSIDLIYGIQNQQEDQWKKNLESAFELKVDHLSCYALTVESGTLLADLIRKKKTAPVDEEKARTDFEWLMKRAEEEGYEHYEISNFARNKKYSRHNTSYWQKAKYLGVGPSAHSFDIESRQWNVSNNQKYIRLMRENVLPFEKEQLTQANKFNEYVLTVLRTMWGIDPKLVESEYGQNKRNQLEKQLQSLIEEGLISKKGNNYVLTQKGKFFADNIASELFE